METVRCQKELTGRQAGALSGNVLPGDENGFRVVQEETVPGMGAAAPPH